MASTSSQRRSWPAASALARRLARRVWPGPVAISTSTGKKRPTVTRYVPNSSSVRQLVEAFGCPLLFGGPSLDNGEAITNILDLQAAAGDHCSVILDVGTTPYKDFPTLVEVDGSRYRIAVEGVVPGDNIAIQSSWLVVFVCTGNTCRSPLAERCASDCWPTSSAVNWTSCHNGVSESSRWGCPHCRAILRRPRP